MKKTRWIALAAALGIIVCLLAGCAGDTHDARTGVVRVLSVYEVKESNDERFVGDLNIRTGSAFGAGVPWEETDVFVTNRHVVENYTDTLDVQALLDEEGLGRTYEDLGLYSPILERKYVLTDLYILLDDYACKISAEGEMSLDPSRSVPCKILHQAPSNGPDLAILQAANIVPGRVALPMTKAEEGVKVGDNVTAIGYPGDSDLPSIDEYANQTFFAEVESSTLTKGEVSRFTTMASKGNTKIIQHGAQITNGNSGGPLINDKNQVVGINTWDWGDNSLGAIYADYAIDALNALGIELPSPKPTVDVKVILVAAIAVVAVAIVLVLVLGRRGKGKKKSAQASLFLVGSAGALAGSRYPLGGEQLVMGCDPARCRVVFPDQQPGVSHVHCCVWADNGRAYLRDMGSTYGTFVNGVRIAPGETRELMPGMAFSLGSPKESFMVTREGGV